MIRTVEMNRPQGTAKTFSVDIVDDGYIRIIGGVLALGRRCANKRRDELMVNIEQVKAAIAEYESAQREEVQDDPAKD